MWSSASSTSSPTWRSSACARYHTRTVDFSTRVSALQQFEDRVEIAVEGAAGSLRISGPYLIGADGGRSTVRKALGIAFEGYTHPERFLVLTTPFSFDAQYAQCSRNYFSDPDEWCALFKVTGDDGSGLWRALFPTRLEESDEQALDEVAVQRRLQKFFPKEVHIRSCIATSITCTSGSRLHSAAAASFSPAIPRM